MLCKQTIDTIQYISLTVSGAAKGGVGTGHLPPPLGLRQTLGRECTYQADQGKTVIYNNRVDKIKILLGYLY